MLSLMDKFTASVTASIASLDARISELEEGQLPGNQRLRPCNGEFQPNITASRRHDFPGPCMFLFIVQLLLPIIFLCSRHSLRTSCLYLELHASSFVRSHQDPKEQIYDTFDV